MYKAGLHLDTRLLFQLTPRRARLASSSCPAGAAFVAHTLGQSHVGFLRTGILSRFLGTWCGGGELYSAVGYGSQDTGMYWAVFRGR